MNDRYCYELTTYGICGLRENVHNDPMSDFGHDFVAQPPTLADSGEPVSRCVVLRFSEPCDEVEDHAIHIDWMLLGCHEFQPTESDTNATK